MEVLTSSSADFKATGMQTSTIPARAIAVLRFQCTGLQYGPPLILQTLVLKSPPWEWSPPPAIFPSTADEKQRVFRWKDQRSIGRSTTHFEEFVLSYSPKTRPLVLSRKEPLRTRPDPTVMVQDFSLFNTIIYRIELYCIILYLMDITFGWFE